jgi:uncharacterized Zn finger protein (UPF0148 family)
MLVTQRIGGESMKCPFCGGPYVEKGDRVACLMCDRTMDIKHEIYVQREQRKPHRNWHVYTSLPIKFRRKSDEAGY